MSDDKTITVEQYEIMMAWKPYVEAAGLYHHEQRPWNIYSLAGPIMDDAIVSKRRAQRAKEWLSTANLVGLSDAGVLDAMTKQPDFLMQVLLEMTPEEKAALKARIVAAHQQGQAK